VRLADDAFEVLGTRDFIRNKTRPIGLDRRFKRDKTPPTGAEPRFIRDETRSRGAEARCIRDKTGFAPGKLSPASVAHARTLRRALSGEIASTVVGGRCAVAASLFVRFAAQKTAAAEEAFERRCAPGDF